MSFEGNIDQTNTFRDHIDQLIRMCLDDIWIHYSTQNGMMTKWQMRSFVKHLISEMGDHKEFSDWDFEDCYRKTGFNDQKNLHSREDITRFIKKVIDYHQTTH